LQKLGIDVRLSTGLTALPPAEPGRAGPFVVTTDQGDGIAADIWFRAFGVRINTDYLADGRLTKPDTVYTPAPERRILLPLGNRAGVGQLPTPDGPAAATPEMVYQRKGADLCTAKFATRFGDAGEAVARLG
jgi:hypothetical protein